MPSSYTQPIVACDRYAISYFLSCQLPKPHKAYMVSVDRFLTSNHLFEKAALGIKGISSSKGAQILRVISNASLGWGKPYEKLSHEEFTVDRTVNSSFVSDISVATVKRGINALKDAGLIYVLSQGIGFPCSYALCLSGIFLRLEPHFPIVKEARSSKESNLLKTWRKLLSSSFIGEIDSFSSQFAHCEFHSMAQVAKFVKDKGGAMAMLKSNIVNAKNEARLISNEKSLALAQQPFFAPDGTPNSRAALEFWHREARDSELYSDYRSYSSPKALGQMKNWLKELKASDYTEEEIRDMIHEYTNKWAHVPEKKREITSLSRNGKNYKVRMYPTPDFQFFYANRGFLMGLLSETCEEGKNESGRKLMTLEEIRAL